MMTHCLYYAYWGDHNVNPRPHLHDQLEIYISLNNIGDFFLQEKKYPLQVGSLFLIHPFEIHHGFAVPMKPPTAMPSGFLWES